MQKFYKHRFESPKKPGTLIFEQTEEEKKTAELLTKTIRKHWAPPKYFYHLVKGGHLRALHRHKADTHFVRLDIANFFGSISRNKASRALKKIGLPFIDAQSIAHRSCVAVDGARFLPFGYVQSPLIASIVLDTSALGRALKIVQHNDVKMSVFMDDIVLSHPNAGDPLAAALTNLAEAATQSHFAFSAEKLQGPAALVTVFNIDLEHQILALSAERYGSFASRITQQGNSDSTKGILGYVEQINQNQHAELAALVE